MIHLKRLGAGIGFMACIAGGMWLYDFDGVRAVCFWLARAAIIGGAAYAMGFVLVGIFSE